MWRPETTESRKEKRKVTEEVRDRPKTSAENPRKVVRTRKEKQQLTTDGTAEVRRKRQPKPNKQKKAAAKRWEGARAPIVWRHATVVLRANPLKEDWEKLWEKKKEEERDNNERNTEGNHERKINNDPPPPVQSKIYSNWLTRAKGE